MPKIIQLSPHVANLIAAGEVVERPASVVKELLENAVDAGASKVTVELRNGGMTFLRVTDNGCGMSPEDARTAFLRHATSKLREPEDLNAIGTMGFRGEALAAIAAVSPGGPADQNRRRGRTGVSLHLEAGAVTEESEAGCPEGTTIIVRDLFFNTPGPDEIYEAGQRGGGRCGVCRAAPGAGPSPGSRAPAAGWEGNSQYPWRRTSCCPPWPVSMAGRRPTWSRWTATGRRARCGALCLSPPRPGPAGLTRSFS